MKKTIVSICKKSAFFHDKHLIGSEIELISCERTDVGDSDPNWMHIRGYSINTWDLPVPHTISIFGAKLGPSKEEQKQISNWYNLKWTNYNPLCNDLYTKATRGKTTAWANRLLDTAFALMGDTTYTALKKLGKDAQAWIDFMLDGYFSLVKNPLDVGEHYWEMCETCHGQFGDQEVLHKDGKKYCTKCWNALGVVIPAHSCDMTVEELEVMRMYDRMVFSGDINEDAYNSLIAKGYLVVRQLQQTVHITEAGRVALDKANADIQPDPSDPPTGDQLYEMTHNMTEEYVELHAHDNDRPGDPSDWLVVCDGCHCEYEPKELTRVDDSTRYCPDCYQIFLVDGSDTDEIWLGKFETPNFSFEVVGCSEAHCKALMHKAWAKHAEISGADPEYFSQYEDDFFAFRIVMGQMLRDNETLH